MSTSALWAKKAKDTEGLYWLPLKAHLTDTAEVARKLWREWLPENVKQIIIKSIEGDEEEAERFFIFLAAAHDIGKATPVFQATRSIPVTSLDLEIYNRLEMNGFRVKENRDKYRFHYKTPHALISQMLLEKAIDLGLSDTNLCKNAAVILGSHHGKSPNEGDIDYALDYDVNFGHGFEDPKESKIWMDAQSELIHFALSWGNYKILRDVPCPSMPGQVLLTGLLIMADWIASDKDKFLLFSLEHTQKTNYSKRVQEGWNKIDLPETWSPHIMRNDDGLYSVRFDFKPNDKPNNMQKAAVQIARSLNKPGIMVVEAPMGSGKTEAALVVAEVFGNTANCGGVFFALPTQATSDGIFPRLMAWVNKLDFDEGEKRSVNLAHGKAQFNKKFRKLFEGDTTIYEESDEDNDGSNKKSYDNEESTAFVHHWFIGRKKSMLADFVVGTIDQLLLMALKQKHVMLRHLGFAGKVVIIDECHAYDAYMNQYLKMALRWLGTYGVPVIVLSATLPGDRRQEVIGAYLGNENITGDWTQCLDYPLITYTDHDNVKSCAVEPDRKEDSDSQANTNPPVTMEVLDEEKIVDRLEDLLIDGGCAGIIMNTVQRAQETAWSLRKRFKADTDTVELIHSRFLTPVRMTKEENLRNTLGKKGQRPKGPEKFIVVGTQVLEQSLDIDFDVMVTDIAPMDLMLQRIGRLHRHENNRPKQLSVPICLVTGIDGDSFGKGIDSVYSKYLLMRTKNLLDNYNWSLSLPKDISYLVNAAYDKNADQTPEKDVWDKEINDKKTNAKAFRIDRPMTNANDTIENWLRTDVDDVRGEATVRDSYDSVEVLVIKKISGEFFLLDEGGTKLPKMELDNETARLLACQRVSLPRMLSHKRTIDELENVTKREVPFWQKSYWISGELFLILDGDNRATLCGHVIRYMDKDGLYIDESYHKLEENEP